MVSRAHFSRRARTAFRNRFTEVCFATVAGLIATAALLETVWPELGFGLCIVNMVLLVVYFAFYINLFRSLNDLYDNRRFYLTIYEPWGVIFFNLLFFINISYAIYLAGKLFGIFDVAAADITFNSVILYTVQNTLDAISNGLLGAFDLSFSNFQMQGFVGKSLVYLYNLIVEFFILAAIFREINESRRTRKELRNITAGKEFNQDFFKEVNPKKLMALLRVFQDDTCPLESRKYLLSVLSASQSKEIKDIFLKLLHQTDSAEEFQLCLDYFKTNRDHRFRKQVRRIRAAWKHEALKAASLI